MSKETTPTPETDAAAEFIHDRGMTEWVPVEVSLSLERRLAAAEAELQAWQSQFGTSQLTHALARLEAAESRALTAVNRFHEAQVELLRLAALTPKIWTAETISEAPRGIYHMMNNGYDGRRCEWDRQTRQLDECCRHWVAHGRYWKKAFGPLPTPPMKEGE